MKRLILLFVLIAAFCACSNQEQNTTVIEASNTDYKDWFSLIQIESITPLGDTFSSPKMSIARKCVIGKKRILFWDYKAKVVYVYNNHGDYLYTVGGLGHAQNEYIDLSDVAFSIDQSRILILDKTGIKVYNAQNGLFLFKKEFKGIESSSIRGFMPCEDNSYLLFTPENKYSISKVDGNNHVTPLRKRNGYQMIYKRFNYYNGVYTILPDYGKFTVDYIENNEISPKYVIDLGDKALPNKLIPSDYIRFSEVDDMSDYFKVILDYYENNDAVYMSLVGPNQTYYDLLYNKNNNRVYLGPHDTKTNIVITGVDNKYLYGLIYIEYVDEKSPLYQSLTPYRKKGTHNPLLVKIKLFQQ